MRLLDMAGVSTPQLLEIKRVLRAGVPASADKDTLREVNMEDKDRITALEQENKDLKGENVGLKTEKETWNSEKSTTEIATLKEEKETWATEKVALEEKASQVETLTKELTDQKEELETLRKFKTDSEEAAERAERLKSIKVKLDGAEIAADVETDADYWLSMTEDTLDKTISKMKELKKGSSASASIKVPPVSGDDAYDVRAVVAEGLKEHKQAQGGN